MSWLPLLALPTALIVSSSVAFANPPISLEAAATLAQGRHNGLIVEIELEDDGRTWEIEFADDTEIKIDARSGTLIKHDQSQAAASNLNTISVWDAVAIARMSVPTSEPVEAELEFDDGRLLWEVEFANGTEVEIDAISGIVLDIDD